MKFSFGSIDFTFGAGNNAHCCNVDEILKLQSMQILLMFQRMMLNLF